MPLAGELVVTESAVKSHVSQVLRKLAARDRVQLLIAAYEAGLVGGEPSRATSPVVDVSRRARSRRRG